MKLGVMTLMAVLAVIGITASVVPKIRHLCSRTNQQVVCGDTIYPHSRLVTGNGGAYIRDDQAGSVMSLPAGVFCKQSY
jgi:hypothetical protein